MTEHAEGLGIGFALATGAFGLPAWGEAATMTPWDWVRSLAILAPIVALLLIGVLVAVRSGVSHFASVRNARLAVENLSHTVLVVIGSILGLALAHQLVGQRVPLGW